VSNRIADARDLGEVRVKENNDQPWQHLQAEQKKGVPAAYHCPREKGKAEKLATKLRINKKG